MKIGLIGAGSSVGRYLLAEESGSFFGIYRSERALSQLCDKNLAARLVRAVDADDLINALRGCDAVVTLINDENPQAALDSLRQAVKACAAANVKRLIHMSSAAIYGRAAERALNVDAGGATLSWSSYAAGKQWQENFLKANTHVLPSILVLRPGLIWGPGMAWFHAPAGEVLRGEAWIAEGDSPCNLVHIRLLTYAIKHFAQSAPAGLNFCNIYDRERLTWSEYYQGIARSFGVACNIQMVPRKQVPPWLKGGNAARYIFPVGLAWSILPKPLKNFVKTVVRSIPRSRKVGEVVLDTGTVPHLSINREVWELKTARTLPPAGELLEKLYESYPFTERDHWADVESLRSWMWV